MGQQSVDVRGLRRCACDETKRQVVSDCNGNSAYQSGARSSKLFSGSEPALRNVQGPNRSKPNIAVTKGNLAYCI